MPTPKKLHRPALHRSNLGFNLYRTGGEHRPIYELQLSYPLLACLDERIGAMLAGALPAHLSIDEELRLRELQAALHEAAPIRPPAVAA